MARLTLLLRQLHHAGQRSTAAAAAASKHTTTNNNDVHNNNSNSSSHHTLLSEAPAPLAKKKNKKSNFFTSPRKVATMLMPERSKPNWLSTSGTTTTAASKASVATAAATTVPSSSSSSSSWALGWRWGYRRLDRMLAAIEMPARSGWAATKELLLIAIALGTQLFEIASECYTYYLHFRVRRLLRFAVGIPFFFGTVFILVMRHKYFPESPVGLSTESVAGLPLCYTVDELLTYTLTVRRQYREMLRNNSSSSSPLSATDLNEVLRGLLVLIRSMETVMVGSVEERMLIEPQRDLIGAPPTDRSAAPRPTSPAEFVLRVILSIALEQGWFDVVESARHLFSELVQNNPLPIQARVVQAVGDLCSLSYELERCTSSAALTLDQRKRVARAIDTFRPERAVGERCTISAEITVLPLSDGNGSTRCLSMIRHSPGRKPQLIMCFVGSNSLRNWLTNFYYLTRPLPEAFGVGGEALVHKGFFHLVESVPYTSVAEDFDQIILVGHSLGGALAQLAGLRLAAERPSRRITVVTMASPRVLAVDTDAIETASTTTTAASGKRRPVDSDAALAEHLELPRNYRHFRGFLRPDAVTQLPPHFLGYAHVGRRIPLQTGCSTFSSFIGWGMWSKLFHSSELYGRVLADPLVAQTHAYQPTAAEAALWRKWQGVGVAEGESEFPGTYAAW